MRQFDEKSVLNYISERKHLDEKASSMKPVTIRIGIGLSFLFIIPNILKPGDPVNRLFLIIQIAVVILQVFLYKFWMGVSLRSEVPNDKRFQIVSLLCFLIIANLMYIGELRLISDDADVILPISGIALVVVVAFIFERYRIMRAMENNEGIVGKPFENLKEPTDGIGPCIAAVITGIALGKHLNLFGILLMLGAVFTSVAITRVVTQHIYVLYFAKKYHVDC